MDEVSVGVGELYTLDARLDNWPGVGDNGDVDEKPRPHPAEYFITAEDAAQLIGCRVDYVWRLARRGKLDARKIGSVWYVRLVRVLHWRRAHGGRGRPPAREPREMWREMKRYILADEVEADVDENQLPLPGVE